MVYLGYMLPTDEKHEQMIKNLATMNEMSVEAVLNLLIEKADKEGF